MTFWPAPTLKSGIPVCAKIEIPSSKSLTNRYLILAALSDSPSIIKNPLLARDTSLMVEALRKLGTKIDTSTAPQSWKITPRKLSGAKIDAGLAGTVMRFIPPIAALASGVTLIDGDPQARKRPMQTTISSLQNLGVDISSCNTHAESLPLRISGNGKITGGKLEIDASASSQFISALLLAGARFEQGLELQHIGDKLPSLPHIEMTLSVLCQAGVHISESGSSAAPIWHVAPGPIHFTHATAETDLSNAGPFLASAMLTAGQIEIPNWPQNTTQAGAHFASIFEKMGAKIAFSAHGSLLLHGPKNILPIDLDCHAIGELVPTLAAVCAFATDTCALRNIGQLRGHETDRLAALTTELTKIGVTAKIIKDDLIITPPTAESAGYHGALLNSYADHRMATFGAILGLRINGIRIDDIETTAKTLPNFVQLWENLISQSAQSKSAENYFSADSKKAVFSSEDK